jgi:hypothetical protein
MPRPKEALLTKPAKRKPNGQQPSTAVTGSAHNDRRIPYEEAVAEGKDIITRMDGEQRRHQMRLGELAARVETKYADRTVAKLAKEIGVSDCTLKRYLSVYRAWDGKGIEAPGPVSYAVLRELQDHPDREVIVKNNPKITKREAQELKRQYEGKQKKGKSGDWKREEAARWLRRVCVLANDVTRTNAEVKVTRRALWEIAEPKLLTDLRESAAALAEGSATLHLLADQLQRLEDIEKTERKKPDLKEAEREGVAA